MKSLAMYHPRKDKTPNQNINRWITQQYSSLPPIIKKYTRGYKPIFNDTHDPNSTDDEPNDYTNSSRNKDKDFLIKPKTNNNVDKDYEYKDENTAALKNYENVIDKTKEEELLIERLM